MKKTTIILALLCTFGAGSVWAEKSEINQKNKTEREKIKECKEIKWQSEECQNIKNSKIKEGKVICKKEPESMACKAFEEANKKL